MVTSILAPQYRRNKMKENETKAIKIIEPLKMEVHSKKELVVEIPTSLGDLGDAHIMIDDENHLRREKPMKKEEEENTTRYSTKLSFENLGKYYFFLIFAKEGVKRELKFDPVSKEPKLLTPGSNGAHWIVEVVGFQNPDWAKGKIAYQIFVDRFCCDDSKKIEKVPGRIYRKWGELPNWKRNNNGNFHNNDFFGGNIKGITKKLGYLKSLHIGIIYISPINASCRRYDRYATIDHMSVDINAGSFKDLEELHKKARKIGIYVILDVAFNHCDIHNQIFQEALGNPTSEYRDWFYIEPDGTYQYWYEFKDMPIFNQTNLHFRQYVKDVVAKFSQYVDGFRLDLAESLKTPLLEDIRKTASENGASLIIGECWNGLKEDVIQRGLYAPTNYLFTDAILRFVKNGKSWYLSQQIEYVLSHYPENIVDTMLNSLDTHDITRALTTLSSRSMREMEHRIWAIDEAPSQWHRISANGEETFDTDGFRKFEADTDELSTDEYGIAKKRLKVAAILQYTLPGNPCIYYGTEVGLTGYKDPFNRKCYPWKRQDTELLKFFQKLGEFKDKAAGEEGKNFIFTSDISVNVLSADENVFAFVRQYGKHKMFVAVNRSKNKQYVGDIQKFKQGTTSEQDIFALNADLENDCLLPYGGIIILN